MRMGHFARGVLAALLLTASAAADDAFFATALAAGGTTDACEIAQWQAVYGELRRAVLTDDLLELPSAERLLALHAALHEHVLIGSYQPAASDLRLALSRGDYNCLSAGALYFDLARAAGFELEVWSRPGHVWLQSAAGERIEPATRPGAALANSLPETARQLTPQELLAKFHYNRGVQHLARGEFAAGVELVRTALRLDPQDDDARENLLAGLNNWAAEHLRARRYDEAARLIRQGLAIEPGYEPLVANRRLLP